MTFLYLLLVKHIIVDLALQTHLGKRNKFDYFGNGHVHYLQHGAATFAVALCFLDVQTALLVSVFDYVAHWHIDWGKHHLNDLLKIAPRSLSWWWTNTLDQILHFTTYYVIVVSVL